MEKFVNLKNIAEVKIRIKNEKNSNYKLRSSC